MGKYVDMPTGIGDQLRACGRYGLPSDILVGGNRYRLVKPFKHDFFAATALYKRAVGQGDKTNQSATKVVLKIARRSDFLGLPLSWLGQLICQHEIKILCRLKGLRGAPRYLGSYGKTGLVYEFIAGRSIDEDLELPDDFFDQLEDLLKQIHARGVAYIDMNKRGNILLGTDNQAYLIDYQISLYLSERLRNRWRATGNLLKMLQEEDVYHLYKHKRRLRADLMDEDQLRKSRRISKWVAWHRAGARPLTRFRRRLLYFLHRKDRLITDDVSGKSAETDPARWSKYRR